MRILLPPCIKTAGLFTVGLLFGLTLLAHNGKIAYAYPLGAIKVDGDFSDWPSTAVRYNIDTRLSDAKPTGTDDFSGYFQVGYRADNRSLYLAFTVTDDDFVEDSTKQVRWNTQDGLELSLDARHLPGRSGVTSFMCSKYLRNINNAYYDPFSKNASWKIVEVVMVQKGNTRFYEWRISLGDQFVIGKSVGADFLVFDMDRDSSFTYTSWGKGDAKYRNPNSLGDILLMPVRVNLGTVTGAIAWEKPISEKLPGTVRFTSVQHPATWVQVEVDSTGAYAATIPPGNYTVQLPDAYFQRGKKLYGTASVKAITLAVKGSQSTQAPSIYIPSTPVPDLVPEKGILHQFTAADAAKVDQFVETYQQYYKIPGVSLALIKDGKLAYYKTYGVKNSFTGEKVDSLTLFEAASITKPVFSLAVQKLAERGVIDLDKPLYLYLPYKDIEYDDRYKLITATHVLTHRTGFPNWRWMTPDNKLKLLFTPGTQYNYSGEGFEYLKMVVEKITGKKVEQVLQEEVIEPVGLYHTFFSRNDSLRALVANGHNDGLPNYDELPDSPGMAYSMHTEARIFTRFMLYLLEQKGLKASTYENMWRKHSDFVYDADDDKPTVPEYMGMSFQIRETPFGKSFGHGGNNGDFRCQFEVYKDLKMGYVLFTNADTAYPLLDVMRRFLVEGKGQ